MSMHPINLDSRAAVERGIASGEGGARLRLAGHRLTTRWNNPETADGYCECGWTNPVWTGRMERVRDAHQGHLFRELVKAAQQHGVSVPKDWL